MKALNTLIPTCPISLITNLTYCPRRTSYERFRRQVSLLSIFLKNQLYTPALMKIYPKALKMVPYPLRSKNCFGSRKSQSVHKTDGKIISYSGFLKKNENLAKKILLMPFLYRLRYLSTTFWYHSNSYDESRRRSLKKSHYEFQKQENWYTAC